MSILPTEVVSKIFEYDTFTPYTKYTAGKLTVSAGLKSASPKI